MSLQPLHIVFTLDDEGVMFDPFCPIHFDGLLDWCLSPLNRTGSAPARHEKPEEIRLPLGTWHYGGTWGWCASALFPVGVEWEEEMRYIRKKVRTNRLSLTSGNINLQSGKTREWNLPLTLQHIPQMEAWCLGERQRFKRLLEKNLRYLGKKRHRGFGRIEDLSIDYCDDDYSVLKNGKAQRWLPDKDGLREVRVRPPYWNNIDRIACCEVGDLLEV